MTASNVRSSSGSKVRRENRKESPRPCRLDHRVRTEDKNASRTIDIDIILFDGVLLDPDLWQHVHRALPVSELLPDCLSKDGETLQSVAQRLARSTPIQRREDVRIRLAQ